MHELTLTLPDDLYRELRARAVSQGIPIEGLIVERLAAEVIGERQEGEAKHRLREALASTGLVQPVSSELVSAYVTDPSAPHRNPIPMRGKPLSAVIIEQRAGRE
jgi:hypothetical protein